MSKYVWGLLNLHTHTLMIQFNSPAPSQSRNFHSQRQPNTTAPLKYMLMVYGSFDFPWQKFIAIICYYFYFAFSFKWPHWALETDWSTWNIDFVAVCVFVQFHLKFEHVVHVLLNIWSQSKCQVLFQLPF